MSLTPLFVSAATIKEYGIIENNVDVKLINSTTLMVQDIQLQQIIGTALYKELSEQIDTKTTTAKNDILLKEYIQNYIMNAVIAEGCITFLYRFSNKAVVTSNSENQFPISERQVELIEAKWKNQASFYGKRLSEFLCANSNDYPLYYNGNNESNDINPKPVKYNTGFFLGHTRTHNEQRRNYPYCKDC